MDGLHQGVNWSNDDWRFGAAAGRIFATFPEIESDSEPLGLELIVQIRVIGDVLALRQQSRRPAGCRFDVITRVVCRIGMGGYEKDRPRNFV